MNKVQTADWIQPALDMFQWRPLVYTVLRLPCPIKDKEFLNQLVNYRRMKKDLLPLACYVVSTVKLSLCLTN
jgi:hypothetical protein